MILSMNDVLNLSISQLISGFKNGDFSCELIARTVLDRIHKLEKVNAYITICDELALKEARESDNRYKNGTNRKLEGVPFAIKDLFCTKGVLTTSASKMLSNFVPEYESTVTERLRNDGVVMLGKTNMDEFAMGSCNTHSYYGPVINPWKRKDDNKDLVPGGSSGGSAAAVAWHMCYGALGSDTGGSIRQPASFCGIVGVKPTYGRCSRYGMIAFASSLDQAGPITKTVLDSALVLSSISGRDVKDSTSADVEVPDFTSYVGSSIKGKRVGIPKEYKIDGISSDVVSVWDKCADILREAGCEVKEISLPYTKYALPTYYMLATAEASSNLSRFDGMRYGYRTEGNSLTDVYEETRAQGFGKEVMRRILTGTYALSSIHLDDHYIKARKVQRLIQEDFIRAFKEVDLILTPTTPTGALPIDEKHSNPVDEYLNDVFTVTVNLGGVPAISVPAGYSNEGTPLGIQIISPTFREDLLFAAGCVIEKNVGFKPWEESL